MTYRAMDRACIAITIIHMSGLFMLEPYLFLLAFTAAIGAGLLFNPNSPYFIIFCVTISITTMTFFYIVVLEETLKTFIRSHRWV
jgi:hypothetical protein